MSVTNNIRDDVIFDELGWREEKLTNTEIVMKLLEEKGKGFLNFSTGVYVTAYARRNLLENVRKLDRWTAYCDTDSIKLAEGFDEKIILDYNKKVEEKLYKISKKLKIDFNEYKPKDQKGNEHLIGLFDCDRNI